MKLLKSFKVVILQLMAFRFRKLVCTRRTYSPIVVVIDDDTLDLEGVSGALFSFLMWPLCNSPLA